MKTTLDLPDALVGEIAARAQLAGIEFKDEMAELLRKGLAASPAPRERVNGPIIKTHPLTGLPYVEPSRDAPISKMSTDEIYAFIHQLQDEEDLERFGDSLRR